jgi:hypothetical protein
MWSKEIEKRRKASGFKREKLKRSNPLETSSISLLVMAGIQVATGFYLNVHMLKASG